LIALALLVQAVPPPAVQVTADCARPTYATDQLVCADPDLRAADDRLRTSFGSVAEPAAARLLEARYAWFRRSRRCAFEVAHAACVAAAYREASAVVTALGAPPAGRGRCRLADRTPATVGKVAGGYALMSGARVIAVGMADISAWRPFTRYERVRTRLIFRDLAGEVVATCGIN